MATVRGARVRPDRRHLPLEQVVPGPPVDQAGQRVVAGQAGRAGRAGRPGPGRWPPRRPAAPAPPGGCPRGRHVARPRPRSAPPGPRRPRSTGWWSQPDRGEGPPGGGLHHHRRPPDRGVGGHVVGDRPRRPLGLGHAPAGTSRRGEVDARRPRSPGAPGPGPRARAAGRRRTPVSSSVAWQRLRRGSSPAATDRPMRATVVTRARSRRRSRTRCWTTPPMMAATKVSTSRGAPPRGGVGGRSDGDDRDAQGGEHHRHGRRPARPGGRRRPARPRRAGAGPRTRTAPGVKCGGPDHRHRGTVDPHRHQPDGRGAGAPTGPGRWWRRSRQRSRAAPARARTKRDGSPGGRAASAEGHHQGGDEGQHPARPGWPLVGSGVAGARGPWPARAACRVEPARRRCRPDPRRGPAGRPQDHAPPHRSGRRGDVRASPRAAAARARRATPARMRSRCWATGLAPWGTGWASRKPSMRPASAGSVTVRMPSSRRAMLLDGKRATRCRPSGPR